MIQSSFTIQSLSGLLGGWNQSQQSIKGRNIETNNHSHQHFQLCSTYMFFEVLHLVYIPGIYSANYFFFFFLPLLSSHCTTYQYYLNQIRVINQPLLLHVRILTHNLFLPHSIRNYKMMSRI